MWTMFVTKLMLFDHFLQRTFKQCPSSVRQTMSIKCKGKMLFSVSAMLNKLNWASLKERRDTLRLAMLYKIVNNLVESYVT